MGCRPLVDERTRYARQALFLSYWDTEAYVDLPGIAKALGWHPAEFARLILSPMLQENALTLGSDSGRLLAKQQVAFVLGLTVARVSRFCREGRLGTKVGRTFVVKAGQLRAFIVEREPEIAAQASGDAFLLNGAAERAKLDRSNRSGGTPCQKKREKPVVSRSRQKPGSGR